MSRVKSFLNRLLGRSEHVDTGVEHDPADPFQGLPNPAFFVNALFDTLPQNLDDMLPRLDDLLAKTALPDVAPATLDAWTELPLGWSATLTAGPYMVVLNGKRTPLTPEQQHTSIHFSNWNDEQQERLRAHRAHVHLSCWTHLPPDQTLTLLYAVATALQPLGVTDETAFNCVVADALDLALPRQEGGELALMPTLFWTGLLKFHRPDDGQVYYTTRGFERFGKPNLAWLAPVGSGEEAAELFDALLNYQYHYGQVFAHGHTAEMRGRTMRFSEPTEYAEYLSGGLPVLTVEVRRPN
ncbi:hypothetical protein [Deinococcus knuensis]|uniref:DUF4261 domain-containing protein n=1 Tax=Deinococcus knuensis TaxID=1837380 RepID=A0ABQ2SF71_9DEIO|nr:hypothetical protein [Deinococcus knuensis]GGS19599.1 hypothetical protein GCM10008961_08960 [Deinococcus knuensis]